MNVDLPGIQGFRLDGQCAIITGGSKGLGLAMASGLASAGANIVLVSRNEDQASEAAKAIANQYAVEAIGLRADVSDISALEEMAERVNTRFGSIEILINSAGINIRGPIDELEPAQFDEVMSINVNGTWNANRAIIPYMKNKQYGRIINLASTLGVVGLANRTPYASSKGAVVQMTRALGLELAPFGITCNAICPGPFLTEMNIPIADSEEAKKFIVGAVALERWGELEEIQGAALYLSSRFSSFTTGSLLTVDGGWTAR
ncbi:MAG: SDR family NAD(P)-dependent oxidoreductase [Aureliella sp.]